MSSIQTKEILSFEEIEPMTIVEFFAIDIEPKQSNDILKFINKNLPELKNFQYLKRFRRTELENEEGENEKKNFKLTLLLCPCNEITREALDQLYTSHGPELALGWHPYVVEVPKFAPLNADQFNQCKPIWPVSYKEIKIGKEPLTSQELENLEKYIKSITPSNPTDDKLPHLNSVIITDLTSSGESITSRYCNAQPRSPIDHAIMNCIGIVAQYEVERRKALNQQNHLKRKSIDDGVEPNNTPISPTDPDEKGYLCKDLDVIVTYEPCVMCSMALVHSRIGRLFYLVPHNHGAIESNYRMHKLNNLNHRFRAFEVKLVSE